MTDWVETERCGMRPFEESDADEAFSWFSDPKVMKYIPGGPDMTLGDTRSRIARYREHRGRFGLSKRLIIHRETGKAIGDAGLFHLPDGNRVELGFRLTQSFWGAGYAMEVGAAWLGWFDKHFSGEPLFADVHADHVRSQRVLTRLGFCHSHSEVISDLPMLIYQRDVRPKAP
jgi:ribosomal-protein-alanine N-acetyltransferase